LRGIIGRTSLTVVGNKKIVNIKKAVQSLNFLRKIPQSQSRSHRKTNPLSHTAILGQRLPNNFSIFYPNEKLRHKPP